MTLKVVELQRGMIHLLVLSVHFFTMERGILKETASSGKHVKEAYLQSGLDWTGARRSLQRGYSQACGKQI